MPDSAQSPSQKEPLDLRELEACLKGGPDLIIELLRSVRSLPKVAENGSSECPFAEDWYAKKEELQFGAQSTLKRLGEYAEAIEQLTEQISRDMAVVSDTEDRVHGGRAREHLSDAEAGLNFKRGYYRRTSRRIQKMIGLLQKAIAEASGKRFPNRVPRRRPKLQPLQPSVALPPLRPDAPRPGADQERLDIFELERLQHRGLEG